MWLLEIVDFYSLAAQNTHFHVYPTHTLMGKSKECAMLSLTPGYAVLHLPSPRVV